MQLAKNLVLEGVFSVETPDTAGEVLSIAGADISDLQTGKAPLNTEHVNPEDAANGDLHKEHPEFRGFNTIVGRVINAKKIFSQDDCENDREVSAWNEFKKPLIYGQVEIWDGPEAHDNARAAASIARMFRKNAAGPQLGLSVEGATIKREGNILQRTVIRKMAVTLKPANKAATINIVKDANAPVTKNEIRKTTYDGHEVLMKSVSMQYIHTVPIVDNFGLSSALSALRKALTSGTPSAAPSALTGGAALQPESQLGKLKKILQGKAPTKELIKAKIPTISDSDAEKIEQYFKKKRAAKSLAVIKNSYEEMTGKKC